MKELKLVGNLGCPPICKFRDVANVSNVANVANVANVLDKN